MVGLAAGLAFFDGFCATGFRATGFRNAGFLVTALDTRFFAAGLRASFFLADFCFAGCSLRAFADFFCDFFAFFFVAMIDFSLKI